ncbi:MAG: hypothetical protein LBU65_13830 [Planctomycetaceae bacterium]|jgi:hypothetical protein|nr:hypothetical protein [Planctomycetaceae bacterium]
MPDCPKCKRQVSLVDAITIDNAVMGKCVDCDLIFTIRDELSRKRPQGAAFDCSYYTTDDGSKILLVEGFSCNLFWRVNWTLIFSPAMFEIRWRCGLMRGKTVLHRMFLDSVENAPLNDTSRNVASPNKVFVIVISHWAKSFRNRFRYCSTTIPLGTEHERVWLFNVICDYLEKTSNRNTPAARYAGKRYNGNDTVVMFFEDREPCFRFFCPKCGFRVPVRTLDNATGMAKCTQKFCGKIFSWRQYFEKPIEEAEPEPVQRENPMIYSDGTDLRGVRGLYFPPFANPLQYFSDGEETASATKPNAVLKRPRITRSGNTLTIKVASLPGDIWKRGFAFVLFAAASIFFVTGLAGMSYTFAETTATQEEFSKNFVAFNFVFFYSLLFWLALRTQLFRQFGFWQVDVKERVLTYRRTCLWSKKVIVLPAEKLSEIRVKTNAGGFVPESFSVHQIRFNYGRKQLILPCNGADEQMWIMSELYESFHT